MHDFLWLAGVSAVVSVVVQFLKNRFATTRMGTIGIVIGLSVVAAVAFHFAVNSYIWPTALEILVLANAVYGLIIKSFG